MSDPPSDKPVPPVLKRRYGGPSDPDPVKPVKPTAQAQPVRPGGAPAGKAASPVPATRPARPAAVPKKPDSPVPEATAGPPSGPSAESATPPATTGRQARLLVLGIIIMVVGVGAFLGQFFGWFGEEEGSREIRQAVFPSKKKKKIVPAGKPGIEYHFDRNAILDSRLVESRIVGLAMSGNLVVFDAESYAPRGEKVLHRRATCLGPAENGHVLVGIANGCIVRVGATDLAIERVGDVPGIPQWIGRRAKGGSLLVAYQPDPSGAGNLRLKDLGSGRTYDIGALPVRFLDSKDRLWIGGGARAWVLDLQTSARTNLEWKGGWPGVAGFVELGDGQVWAFGGKPHTGETSSFVARVVPGAKPVSLYQMATQRPPAAAPTSPITHVLEDEAAGQLLVVSHDSVSVTDRSLVTWAPLDVMGGVHREEDAILARGQAHRRGRGVLLSLVRGGLLELTPEYTRRHLLEGQYSGVRPVEIVRLEKGMAFFGDGTPSFYAGGVWRALPDPIMPPAELLGYTRAGESERIWTAMLTIPLDGETSYVIAKAGAPRHYLGHIHGLRDTFLTARWDGKALTILGREDLPIEPADTFVTPDRRLWNVDDQGLWSFTEGRWKLVMRGTGHGTGAVHAIGREAVGGRGRAMYRSAIGEPLHFAESATPPFYGLPTLASSWVLVRLDKNDEGGIPLIDELPVVSDGHRLLIHDLVAWEDKKDEFLLATDYGLCLFNVKWGTCEIQRPAGLDDQVTLIRRDKSKRLWLGGRGLWVLHDLKHAAALKSSIPMLADTRVVAMAEAPDGRLVLGLEDRGIAFLSLPPGALDRPPELPGAVVPWEATRPHEPSFQDPSLVLRLCRQSGGSAPDAALGALLGELRGYAETAGARVRVGFEAVFEGRPDIVVRGADPDQLLAGVTPIIAKHAGKVPLGVWKRRGARGSDAVQVRFCSTR
jgi:hypothetical protein